MQGAARGLEALLRKGEGVRKALLASATLALMAVVVAAAAASAATNGAGGSGNRNAFGLSVVKFAKGTTAAQMEAAVTAAGGVVATNLSKLGAVAAVPSNGDAATMLAKLKTNKLVAAAYQEKVIPLVTPDAQGTLGETGNNAPKFGSGGASTLPDPWHNLASGPFGGAVPGGALQWDDGRMNVGPSVWSRTTGAGIKVAVLDTGVQGSNKELLANYDNQSSTNEIPCNTLTTTYGPGVSSLLGDCSSEDTEGHGTWVAGRIVAAGNGFASNGVAPTATVAGYKVLATGFGGFTSWIVKGMVDACDADADVINMSLGGFDDPFDPKNPFHEAEAQDYLLWVAAANYCRARGTAIFASAGNDHVRIHRVTSRGRARRSTA
jgi:hypothetical protein